MSINDIAGRVPVLGDRVVAASLVYSGLYFWTVVEVTANTVVLERPNDSWRYPDSPHQRRAESGHFYIIPHEVAHICAERWPS